MTAVISSNAQSYSIGNTVIAVPDSQKESGLLNLHIYYPADSSAYELPLEVSDGKEFPLIVFGHGYMMPVKSYENIWKTLVPEGFIVVMPGSAVEMFPSHMDFGYDLLKSVTFMKAKNEDPASPFFGRISKLTCLMGHSMGGGSAVLAAAESKIIDALLLLAPYDTRPSSIEAMDNLTLPLLVFAGTNDCITLPGKHARPIYEASRSNFKTYVEIIGGNHCNMAMKNTLCNIAERTRPENLISREEQHRIMKKYMLPWLNYVLKNDSSSANEFDKQIEADSAVNYLRSLPLSNSYFSR